jgi:hypothetical protein
MDNAMKNAISTRVRIAILVAMGMTLFASPAVPRSTAVSGPPPQKEPETQHHKPQEAIVTGCLIRRDNPGEFALTTRDAKLYYVESSTVDLAAHVRHTVTITGTFVPDKETKDDPDKDQEAQTISATKIEMVRKTCH